MTLRLSQIFEMHIKKIISDWKSQSRRSNKKTNKRSPRKTPKKVPNGTHNSSDDDDDNDDSDDNTPKRPRGRPPKKSSQGSGSNTVTSSVNNEPTPGPSQTRRFRAVRNRRIHSEENGTKSDIHTTSSVNSSSSDDDDDDDDSGDNNNIPLSSLGEGSSSRARAVTSRRNRMYDSGESYKPNQVNANKTKKKKKGRPRFKANNENQTPVKSIRNKRKRYTRSTDDDQQQVSQNGSSTKKRARTSIENNHFTRSQQLSTQSDDNHSSENDIGNVRTRRNRRYESDQSYHLDQTASVRRQILDSDSENDNPSRPTRGSIKRAQMMWGRETDSLEEHNDEENNTSGNLNSNSTNVSEFPISFYFTCSSINYML